ncbi:right-handed parallel beta-helix repeat-containing protein [Candidatus Dependentiae bacterium]|nr:right-handed parallel beta-helix repeat-containing protein [Candidatus Dependentiae bacterium]
MKNINFLFAFFLLCGISFLNAQNDSNESEIISKTEDAIIAFIDQNPTDQVRTNCVLSTQINSRNIPYTINTAGTYCVVENIALSRAGATLITINANNVVLDLNNQTISGFGNYIIASNNSGAVPNVGTNFQNNTTFGNLQSNIPSINSLQGGAFPNITTNQNQNNNTVNSINSINGINTNPNFGTNNTSNGNATNIGTVSGTGLTINGIQVNARSNVTIQNGALINFASNGIFLSPGCQQIEINNVFLFNNNVGILANGINRCLISNCFAALCRTAGILISNGVSFNAQNSIISKCYAFGTGIGSSTAGPGFSFGNCSNFLINQCIAYGNRGNGFQQTACTGFLYEQCQSSGNINSAHGFSIENNNTSLESCIADNNQFDGFRANCNQISLENCKSKNNRNGFNFEGGTDGIVLNNFAQNNSVSGFALAAATRAFQVRSNTATGNTTFGFSDLNVTAPLNKFYANFANNNGTNFSGITNVAVSPLPATPINFTTNIAE